MHQIANGRVLVNDGIRRQLILLDSALTNPIIVLDSAGALNNNGYGPIASPLIPYLGDSSLFVEGSSSSLLVIDPTGRVIRTIAAPSKNGFRYLASSPSWSDATGSLFYRMGADDPPKRVMNPAGDQMTLISQFADSAPIVRAKFDVRTVDTVGRIKQRSGSSSRMTRTSTGGMSLKATLSPIETIDEWAVLSDGSVAFVRGHDYHVDWLRADGTHDSTAKLPFGWRRLTDNDKQHLIDSTRASIDGEVASAKKMGGSDAAQGATLHALQVFMSTMPGTPLQGGLLKPARPGEASSGTVAVDFVSLGEMPDYYPPIRSGAVKADCDNNLWILPSVSLQSNVGELVYDVVNAKGELFQRVRVPAKRSIAGFGPGGIVYLMYRDDVNTWYLERTTIVIDSRRN